MLQPVEMRRSPILIDWRQRAISIVSPVQAARERGLTVIPICPFFAAYMQKHAEVQDLLDPAWRRKFGIEQ